MAREKKSTSTLEALNKYNEYNLNLHPLEIVSRYRNPQLQVGDNTDNC